ncbi:hypothetical protein AAFF_G00265910 [Aldrovandia affinis]|uniref:Uncharacterized protein n=1 Tax=Aldrovandia affinis TaxID=143900 RepID=A0AAD7RBY9_9TELE|nr:hypothetical protein AAFF_G00265910 [Aldrovandia affinis]
MKKLSVRLAAAPSGRRHVAVRWLIVRGHRAKPPGAAILRSFRRSRGDCAPQSAVTPPSETPKSVTEEPSNELRARTPHPSSTHTQKGLLRPWIRACALCDGDLTTDSGSGGPDSDLCACGGRPVTACGPDSDLWLTLAPTLPRWCQPWGLLSSLSGPKRGPPELQGHSQDSKTLERVSKDSAAAFQLDGGADLYATFSAFLAEKTSHQTTLFASVIKLVFSVAPRPFPLVLTKTVTFSSSTEEHRASVLRRMSGSSVSSRELAWNIRGLRLETSRGRFAASTVRRGLLCLFFPMSEKKRNTPDMRNVQFDKITDPSFARVRKSYAAA